MLQINSSIICSVFLAVSIGKQLLHFQAPQKAFVSKVSQYIVVHLLFYVKAFVLFAEQKNTAYHMICCNIFVNYLASSFFLPPKSDFFSCTGASSSLFERFGSFLAYTDCLRTGILMLLFVPNSTM